MSRSMKDEAFRPIIRALDDTPTNLRPLRDVIGGTGKKQKRNHDDVDGIDVFNDKPDAPNSTNPHRPGDGNNASGRNDGRDERGRFIGDGNRPWVDREQAGLDKVAGDLGVDITRDQVASRNPGVTGEQIRYYDGLFKNPDGTYTGVEVKSGSAGRSPEQRLFDGSVSVETPAIANLPNVGPIRIVQVILERVP